MRIAKACKEVLSDVGRTEFALKRRAIRNVTPGQAEDTAAAHELDSDTHGSDRGVWAYSSSSFVIL